MSILKSSVECLLSSFLGSRRACSGACFSLLLCSLFFASVILVGCRDLPNNRVRIFSQNNVDLVLEFDGRRITIDEGFIKIDGRTVSVSRTKFQIPPSLGIQVQNEHFHLVKPVADNSLAWQRTPSGIRICGLPLPDLLVPNSLIVKSNNPARFGVRLASDQYSMDPKWGILLAKEDAKEGAESVLIDYEVRRQRICTIASDVTGKLHLILGPLAAGSPSPPEIAKDMIPVVNVLAPAFEQNLAKSDIIPIAPSASSSAIFLPSLTVESKTSCGGANQENYNLLLAKTLVKLKSGNPIKICFVGDSVTCGCCVSQAAMAFPAAFISRLKNKFPQSLVKYSVFGAGGTTSQTQFDKYIKMLTHQKPELFPDLVVVEFVNDLSLSKSELVKNYTHFSNAMRSHGIEVVVCLPHWVSPTLYGFDRDEWHAISSRPYYTVLPELARSCSFAIADIGRRSRNAANEGLTPELLLADKVNHPNDRGHAIYAEELMKCLQ